MTQRERVMAIAVGALAVLVGGGFVVYTAYGIYEAKQNAVNAKLRELNDADAELQAAKQKDRLLRTMASRSLPGSANDASNDYNRWLHESLRECDVFPEIVSTNENYLEKGKEYYKLKFEVRARARLDDLTKWLHKFDTMNCLHRMRSIKLSPVEGTKLVSVIVEIETFTLAKVTKEQSKPFETRKLASKTLEESKNKYAADGERLMAKIAGRNLFGPPNHEPSILPIGVIPAVIGKPVDVIVKAKDTKDGTNETDPDALLAYRLVGGDLPPGYSFDEFKGTLRWTPKKKGDYKAIVEVVDDGIPRKTSQQSFTIRVGDAPAPPSQPVAAKPTFDVAKWAFVTAIIQEGEVGQVWINERSSGKSQKLKIGDDIKFGSVNGKVSRIDSTGVEVETGGSKFFAKVGQSLGTAASQAGGS